MVTLGNYNSINPLCNFNINNFIVFIFRTNTNRLVAFCSQFSSSLLLSNFPWKSLWLKAKCKTRAEHFKNLQQWTICNKCSFKVALYYVWGMMRVSTELQMWDWSRKLNFNCICCYIFTVWVHQGTKTPRGSRISTHQVKTLQTFIHFPFQHLLCVLNMMLTEGPGKDQRMQLLWFWLTCKLVNLSASCLEKLFESWVWDGFMIFPPTPSLTLGSWLTNGPR